MKCPSRKQRLQLLSWSQDGVYDGDRLKQLHLTQKSEIMDQQATQQRKLFYEELNAEEDSSEV